MLTELGPCRGCDRSRLHRVIDGADLVDLLGLAALGPQFPGTWFTALLLCLTCGQATYRATLISSLPPEFVALTPKLKERR